LRKIDQEDLIRSDPFILVSGDVISNMNLPAVIEQHKERKKKDPTAVMTMVLKEVGATGSVRPVIDDLVVGIDRKNQQIIHFEDDIKKSNSTIPFGILMEHPEMELRSDLLDCHIDICSPEVLVAFSDNFDYQHLRRDYVRLEATNFELGNRLFAHILTSEYAACIHDPRTYAEVSKDIIKRWTYPVVPDNNFTHTSYQYNRGHIYREHGVNIPRSVKLQKGVVLGSGVTVGEKTYLESCVIGRNCTIESNVKICNAFIWDNVTVCSGAEITSSLVCTGAKISAGAKVSRGCIVSFNAVIGKGKTLPEFCSITTCTAKEDDGFSDDDESAFPSEQGFENDVETVGKDGVGFRWASKVMEDFDLAMDSDEEEARRNLELDLDQALQINCFEQEEKRVHRWKSYQVEDNVFDDDRMDDEGVSESTSNLNFNITVKDMVKDGIESGSATVDNLLLEIKSFKFAQNRTFADCVTAAVAAVLEMTDASSLSGMALVTDYKNRLSKWGELIKRLCVDSQDQLVMIKAVEDYVLKSTSNEKLVPVFRFILQISYDMELISEEILLQWIEQRRENEESDNPKLTKLFNHPQTQEFVMWLEEEEEDESDDEEESDDDDDSSDG